MKIYPKTNSKWTQSVGQVRIMNYVIFPVISSIGFFAILCLFFAGQGYQKEVFELGQAFTIVRYSAYTGIVSIALVVFYLFWQRPTGIKLGILIISGALGIMAFYMPYRQQQIARSVPPIHDITTDVDNPPAFIAIAPLRASAPNSVEYDGTEVARQQREAYPDIRTVVYSQSPAEVFTAAKSVVANMGWQMVDANSGDGRIEATDTTLWFEFKDDVVIRISADQGDSTILDVRSKSRVGKSDVGVNAKRIRAFFAALNGCAVARRGSRRDANRHGGYADRCDE